MTTLCEHGTMTAMAVALAYVYHALAPEEAAVIREEGREEEAERRLKEETTPQA